MSHAPCSRTPRPRRRWIGWLACATVVVVAGCGGNGDDASPATSRVPGEDVVDGPEPAGELDCDAAQEAEFELAFSVQFLASLVSNDQFELIDDGTVDVDFTAIREAVATLRPLDDVENPLGSVDESLDRIDRVAALAAEAAAADDPASTDAFAEIQTIIDDDAAFIGGMGPVNYAYGAACRT